MGSLFKKILIAAVGAAASFYATKVVTSALERKPLKTRMKEGKQKVADIKDSAMQKAAEMKSSASEKMKSMIEEKEDKKDE